MMYALVIIPLLIGCSPHHSAAPDDGSRWWFHVEYLASDDLQGRFPGSDGYRKAADYTAQQFQSLGLQPAGTNGYLQPVDLETRRLIPEKSSVELIINGKSTQLRVPDDALPLVAGKSGELVEAPLVFVGYGLSIPDVNYDDFAGLKTKGAVAVAFMGAPKNVPSLLAAHYSSPDMGVKNEQRLGMTGSLILVNPRVVDLPWPRIVNSFSTTQMEPAETGLGLGKQWESKLVALVNPAAVDRVLKGTGHSLNELSALDEQGKSLPHFAMNAKIRARVVYEAGRVTSPNIVALLPGSDPSLKNEYVLLSAHLDHIGIGQAVKGDSIYNGAMDNASGVATLIEAARLILTGRSPKRSILFLACTAEEEGEVGSQYYAARPTINLRNVIANINLDMYLPLFPLRILRAYGLNESDLNGYLDAAAKENGIRVQDDPAPEQNIFIRSDQYSFIKKGIPALFLTFGYDPGTPEEKVDNAWFEERYHGPADDTKQPVDKQAAAKFNVLMSTLAVRIADAAQRPQWKSDSFFRRFLQ
jgi:hypothetical protein